MKTPMVLLTNDDGQAAEGLLLMRTALIAAGARTLTVAPDGNRLPEDRQVFVDLRPVYPVPAGGEFRVPPLGG